jgi:CYTH domain-containing protein
MSTPLEIERKYLIEYPDIAWLESRPDVTKSEITQVYLLSEDGAEVRLRRRKENGIVTCYRTEKRYVTAVTREEYEVIISKADYEAALTLADPAKSPLRKTRYVLPHGGLHIELDVYPFWDDQAIAEVELPSEDTPVVFPAEVKIIREVTGEKAFKNSELAKRAQ